MLAVIPEGTFFFHGGCSEVVKYRNHGGERVGLYRNSLIAAVLPPQKDLHFGVLPHFVATGSNCPQLCL